MGGQLAKSLISQEPEPSERTWGLPHSSWAERRTKGPAGGQQVTAGGRINEKEGKECRPQSFLRSWPGLLAGGFLGYSAVVIRGSQITEQELPSIEKKPITCQDFTYIFSNPHTNLQDWLISVSPFLYQ